MSDKELTAELTDKMRVVDYSKLPNDYRIPIPKVKEGIELIAGRRWPIIICECGNHEQRNFGKAIYSELIPKIQKPWQYRRVGIHHVRCNECGVSIPKVQFDMKAQKIVQESKERNKTDLKEVDINTK